jgi:hypothetical protein
MAMYEIRAVVGVNSNEIWRRGPRFNTETRIKMKAVQQYTSNYQIDQKEKAIALAKQISLENRDVPFELVLDPKYFLNDQKSLGFYQNGEFVGAEMPTISEDALIDVEHFDTHSAKWNIRAAATTPLYLNVYSKKEGDLYFMSVAGTAHYRYNGKSITEEEANEIVKSFREAKEQREEWVIAEEAYYTEGSSWELRMNAFKTTSLARVASHLESIVKMYMWAAGIAQPKFANKLRRAASKISEAIVILNEE